jgi:hypothetical protein
MYLQIASAAAQAAANVVPTGGAAAKPSSKGPDLGAAAGRSVIVTAMTTVIMAATMEPNPT